MSVDSLVQLLTEPVVHVLEPSRRLYWVFIFSSLVMASIAITIHQKRFDLRAQLRAFFNRRYWLSRSTLFDVGCLFMNNAIRAAVIVPVLGSHLAGTIVVGNLLQSNFGDAPAFHLPMLAIGVLYTLTFFIFEDLSRFSLHLAMHKIPWLWYFHRVHHSATTLTPLTVARVHPIEMSLYYLRGLIVFSGVSGVFIYFFQGRVHGWQILGVDCLGFLFNFFGANLRHSPIQLSFGVLEKWFISPAQHQVHHSRDIAHRNKNFGTCFAFWDKLNGSWLPGRTAKKLEFGLSKR